MKIDKKFSVLIPTYNERDDYLFTAIQSAINQAYPAYEIVVCNDGGANSLPSILKWLKVNEKSLIEKEIENGTISEFSIPIHSGKSILIKYVNCLENKGGARAMNVALKHSTGDYIAWISADDFFYPNFLLISSMSLDYAKISYGGFSEVFFGYKTDDFKDILTIPMTFNDKNNKCLISQKDFHSILLACLKNKSCRFNGCGFTYSRKFVNSCGGFNENFFFMPDFELWLKMSVQGKTDENILAVVSEPLLCRRDHGSRCGHDWKEEAYNEKREQEFGMLEKEFLSGK